MPEVIWFPLAYMSLLSGESRDPVILLVPNLL